MVNRNTLSHDSWEAVYNYLLNTNSLSTTSIHGAMNSKMVKTIGYPIVIISPPLTSMNKLSANGQITESECNILVEIYENNQRDCKILKDEVVAKLIAGRRTLAGLGLKRMKMDDGDYDTWSEGDKKVHRLTFNLTFTYVEDTFVL